MSGAAKGQTERFNPGAQSRAWSLIVLGRQKQGDDRLGYFGQNGMESCHPCRISQTGLSCLVGKPFGSRSQLGDSRRAHLFWTRIVRLMRFVFRVQEQLVLGM